MKTKFFSRWLQFTAALILIAALVAPALPASAGSVAPGNKVPEAVKKSVDQLKADLKKQGYEISLGYFKLFTQDDCAYSYAVIGSCYGNNPAAPYVMPVLPSWPEEFVDPATKDAFGPTREGYSTTFRFDRREAIVILGELPPPAAYFGLQTYLFTRQGTYDTTSPTYQFFDFYHIANMFFHTVPNNPERIQVFSSLSNSNNNVVIEKQSGAAFDQFRFFIITPDQDMNSAIRKILRKASIADKNIFTEPIPSNMRIGLDEDADEFTTLMRYSMPSDGGTPGTRSDTWRKDLPLVVLRIRDTRLQQKPIPYPSVVLETRTAVDEHGLQPDLINLVKKVSERWGLPCTDAMSCTDRAESFIDWQSYPVNLAGPLCTAIGMDCLGDTQDTAYQTINNLPLDNDDVYAVAGTLGTQTGNSTYTGLSVNDGLIIRGLVNISNIRLKDTASEYAGEVSNTDKFYVYYFARDCDGLENLTDGNCVSIPETMIPAPVCLTNPPLCRLSITEREYIRPGTQRGPNSVLILPSMVIKLHRP